MKITKKKSISCVNWTFRKKKCKLTNCSSQYIQIKFNMHILHATAAEKYEKHSKIATKRKKQTKKNVAKQQEETQPQQANVSSCKRKNYYLSFSLHQTSRVLTSKKASGRGKKNLNESQINRLEVNRYASEEKYRRGAWKWKLPISSRVKLVSVEIQRKIVYLVQFNAIIVATKN